MSMPETVTTTVAAKMLGISRPTLMKLIEAGRIPAVKIGTHTRLRSVDVTRFRQERQAQQQATFVELRAIDEALDLDD